MGMDTNRRVHERMFLGQPNSGVEHGRAVTVADGNHGPDPGFERPRDDLLAVGVELLAIEMGVRIDEHRKPDLRPRTSDLGLLCGSCAEGPTSEG